MTEQLSWQERARAYEHTGLAMSQARYFDSDLRLLPGVTLPLRSMFIESIADSILISPVGTAEETMVIGSELTTLVAPSLLHHRHLLGAIDRLAPRELWGPPGLADKRPELGGARVFGRDSWPHMQTLPFVLVEGAPARNEVVFFHPTSRTIYTADLVFAIHEPHGFLAPLAFRALGIFKRFAVARMWSRWIEDPKAFRRSIDQILAWDFDRIAMAHGDLVNEGGKAKLVAALRERSLL
jgi:hypothetical protein